MGMGRHCNPDGTYNGLGVLADLAGLPVDDAVSLVVETIKRNQQLLDGCRYHEFELVTTEAVLLRGHLYRCRHCGGEIDGHKHRWHELGRRPKPEN